MTNNITTFITRAALTLALAMLTAAQGAWAWSGSGTAESPYQIKSTADLDQLATDVNSGTEHEGDYFVLTTDLTYSHETDWNDASSTENNFTPIGGYNNQHWRDFKGHFDGQGHTISGIRIYKSGSSFEDKSNGIFGRIYGGEVKNIFLTDTRITGHYNCGPIAGSSNGCVENCHVLSDVTIHAVTASADYHGGVVGYNTNSGTVTGCTSAATISGDVSCEEHGGIVGSNSGTVEDCIYFGNTVEATKKVGAICGDVLGNGTVRNCYYTSTTFTGKNSSGTALTNDASAIGYKKSGVTIDDVRLATSDDFAVSGDTYTIGTATGWSVMCAALYHNDTYNRFSGKTVRLGDNITVTRIAGSGAGSDLTASDRPFCGTFDGDGNTLTFNYGTSGTPADEDYVAPFRYVSGATIQHLHVAGDIYTQHVHAGGIVGMAYGSSTVTDCRSSVNIHSSINGDGTHGGIMACTWTGSETNITGCLFDGSIQSVGTNVTTTCCGGFVGWRNATINVTNCLLTADLSTVGASDSYTFVRRGCTIQNSYYLTALGTAQGKAPLSVSGGENVTIEAVSPVGSPVENGTYTVSGITAYAKGITRTVDDVTTFYYSQGDQLSLTFDELEGYSYEYTTSGGTLSGTENPYTLTMPDEDVTISVNTADLAPIDWATVNQGDLEDPYMIYNKDQLLLLAHRVNGTNGETANEYQGKYFKLGADITFDPDPDEGDDYAENYEAIGCYDGDTYRYFKGNFNGDGYTVSGIRTRKTGSDAANSNQGLFGCISSGANIHDVHLTDARFTGYYIVGGIVGFNGDGYISGCSVTDSYITAVGEYGTICGENDVTLTNNYYHGCTVNGTAVTSGVGYYEADIADNNGALPAYRLALGENITTPPGTFAGQTVWLATPPVDARLAPENGFTLAGNHYFASGYKFTPGSTLASGAAQGYTPRATLGGQLLDPYTPTGEADPLAGTAIAQFTVSADCDGKTLASTQAIYSTGQPVTVAYVNADGTAGETSAIALDGTETSLAAGTYFAGLENVNFDHTVNLTGDVTLILKDGCTMNVGTSEAKINGHGIAREDGGDQALTICGQTAQTGALNIYTDNGNKGIVAKAVTINGGHVTIDSNGDWATGISAGDEDITINGGNVSVTAPGTNAWAIFAYNNVTINGGTVEASGTADGIRIDNGTIAINGGTVNASGSYGINASYGTKAITLGWTKPTDRITASSYSGTVQVASDKKLHNGSTFLYGTLGDPAAALNGKTLRPAATATYTTADGTAATADAILLDASDNSLPAGNYLATGTLNYTHGITLNGNVTLILADNCHMNVGTSGERIEDYGFFGFSGGSHNITITSQSLGDNMGALSVYTTGMNMYGILANAITIDGGNVTADTNGDYAVALYAGHDIVTINGGTVTANTAGTEAHAIFAIGDFNYNGGNVTATAAAANANAICASGGNYAFSWRTPADRITIGATGLYAPDDGKTATFARLFTDASGNIYTGTLAASVLSGFPAETTLQPCLALADAASNTTAIADHAGQTLAVALTGRTLYKDGSWNTLCLPFSVTDFTGTPLEGAIVKTLVSTDFAAGTLTLNFTEDEDNLTSIEAGKPYIVRWTAPDGYVAYDGTNADECDDIVAPTFTGVTISTATADAECPFTSSVGSVTFKGTYSPLTYSDENKSILFLGGSNTLYYPDGTAPTTIGSQRAYFQLTGLTAGDKASEARAFVLNFGNSDEQTGIKEITDPTILPPGGSLPPVWRGASGYTLDGRRLSAKPAKAGIYIVNGRKVIIK